MKAFTEVWTSVNKPSLLNLMETVTSCHRYNSCIIGLAGQSWMMD